MTKNRPAHEVRIGRIRATIWANQTEDGEGVTHHSVTFSRLYKDNGEWRDAASFGRNDLPLVARVAGSALDWIYSQPSGDAPHAADE